MSSSPRRAEPWRRHVVAVLAVVVTASCATTPAPSGVDLGFPSPLTGPGVPALERSSAQRVEMGWAQLAAGKLDAAREEAARAGGSAPARLLALQATLMETPADVIDELGELTSAEPDYAAAWLTLSVAGERTGDEAVALDAARHGAVMWDRSPWVERAQQLRRRFVDQRVEEGARRLEAGGAGEALELAEVVLALEPLDRAAVLLKARSLIALDRDADAETALTALGADPDALLLSGRIAEQRRDWETAMALYDSLSTDHPERQASLRRVKLQWRMTHLPPCARAALSSPGLTRSQLAIVLVTLAPQLETIDGGVPPVLSDIVDLPCSRDIVTAVRLQLLSSDRLERRFFPARPASGTEVRDAVDGLCHLLGLTPPVWCDETASGCLVLPETVSGEQLAETVMRLLESEEGP